MSDKNTIHQEHPTISALRVDLYECDDHPSHILKPLLPATATRHAWIPQTLGDQIWVLFDFATVEERERWERGLPDRVSRWLDRRLIPRALDFGWHVRDVNGWVVR